MVQLVLEGTERHFYVRQIFHNNRKHLLIREEPYGILRLIFDGFSVTLRFTLTISPLSGSLPVLSRALPHPDCLIAKVDGPG